MTFVDTRGLMKHSPAQYCHCFTFLWKYAHTSDRNIPLALIKVSVVNFVDDMEMNLTLPSSDCI